ncbi:MAG: hypothetical protein VX642_14535 [Bdellovibrionota bacterium]|nr:hypothetical protein [Bdellovibrionota bacterium]
MIDFLLNLIQRISFLIPVLLCDFSVAATYVRDDGSFTDPRDKKLVEFQLDKFVSECIFIGSAEAKNIEKMNRIATMDKKKLNKEQLACYDEHLSKMKSVNFLYRKLCSDLSYNGIPKAPSKMLSQFVTVRQFQDGISLMHIVLNDCLNGLGTNENYIVPSSSAESKTGLIRRLNGIETKMKFRTNRVEIR